ncbi:hypothetical protein Dimus_032237 [Dionaea muscipula]
MLFTEVAPAKVFPRLWILVTLSAVVAILGTNKASNVTLIFRIRYGVRSFGPSIRNLNGRPVQKESSNHLSVVLSDPLTGVFSDLLAEKDGLPILRLPTGHAHATACYFLFLYFLFLYLILFY